MPASTTLLETPSFTVRDFAKEDDTIENQISVPTFAFEILGDTGSEPLASTLFNNRVVPGETNSTHPPSPPIGPQISVTAPTMVVQQDSPLMSLPSDIIHNILEKNPSPCSLHI